ncbi:MAG: SusC/RagA family TonB-linked outer membrane protein [Bacteroidota bacterium]|nr:SusC/RagA family TonB-linked outer membrane protein [Bacteroidota bacterium]
MHMFTKAAKRILLLSLFIGLTNVYSFAQNNSAKPTAPVVTKQKSDGFKVKGVVKEASTGNGLSGINISVPGYSAAITDDKGNFTISVIGKSTVLMISGPGYQAIEVPLKGQKTVEVNLYEDTFQSVYDLAHMPYGNVPLNKIASAVTSFNTDGNWQRTSETPDTYLQGKVSGLNAIRRSGTPAIGADLFLRGYNSLHATNQPLIVVDGIIYDDNTYGNSLITGHTNNPMADIEINDIDNITVVKDGTSFYGTKGANGVILITTARAKDVATKIDFAAYGGFNATPRQIPVMQASDYRTYLSDILKTSGLTDDQIQALPFMNDSKTNNPDYYRYHNQTNWQDQVMKNSYNQNYQLKVTGGDNIATYALSLGYTGNKGITANTSLMRYFTRFNANLKLSSRLTANANLAFTYNEQNLKDQGINDKTNPLYLGLIKAPFLPIYAIGDDGSQSPNLAGVDILNVSNPTAVIQNVQDLNRNYRFSGSVGLKYLLTKNLTASSLVGVTFDKVRENMFIPRNGVTNDTLSMALAFNRSGSNVQRLYSLFNDTRLTYAKTFGYIHDLSLNLGERFQTNTSSQDYGLGYNSATDNFVSVGNGAPSLRQVGGQIGDWNWMDIYLNADYKLLNKYFLSFNTAVDGSSRFGTNVPEAMTVTYNGYEYAFMPSVAAGWLISSEKFMSNVKFIDLLKLRASYGLVGNDDIGNYTAKPYYVPQNLLGMEGIVRGNIANPALKWENVAKMNLGLDAALLNQRLSFSVDVYRNHTDNMITYEPINTTSGFSYAITNNGAMKTTGIEVAVNGRLINRTLKWDLGLILSHSKNEITKIPGNQLITPYANAYYISQVGSEANLFYGYKTNGIYKTNAEAASAGLSSRNSSGNLVPFQGGDVKFVDLNGDKVIDSKDMQVIGNPNPDFTGAISNVISWKRFSFDALITFSKGNDIYNYTRYALESMSGAQNQTLDVINRWRADGQITNVPRAVWGDPTGNSRFSDRWIEDGSYIRLRTISMTYDYPIKPGLVKYMKVYATGNNVVTLTKYLGYDPEFSPSGSIFGQGIDLGLEPQFMTLQLGVRVGL